MWSISAQRTAVMAAFKNKLPFLCTFGGIVQHASGKCANVHTYSGFAK